MATFEGTAGPDLIDRSSDPASTLLGLKGNDTLTGGSGDDTLNGGSGRDSLTGGAGHDSLYGAEDRDWISGGEGNDTLDGDYNWLYDDGTEVPWNRDDTLLGGAGDDSIQGGSGNDHLTGGPGNDTLTGSGDYVYAYFSGTRSEYSVLYTQQSSSYVITDNVGGRDGVDTAYWVTMFVFTDGVWTQKDLRTGSFTPSGGGLVLPGSAGNDTIVGDMGPDSITGGDGSDSLEGGVGDDTVLGGAEFDYILGGSGNDSLDGGEGNDTLIDIYGSNTLVGGNGHDFLEGGLEVDLLVGGDGNDVLHNCDAYDDGQPDTLIGGAGNDSFVAGFRDVVDAGDGPLPDAFAGDSADFYFLDATEGMYVDLRPMVHGGAAVMNHGGASGIEFANVTGSAYGDFIANVSVAGGYQTTLAGWWGDDTFVGGAGVELIFGDDGIDTVIVEGPSWEYEITFDGWTYHVADKLGRYGADQLSFVEYLQFSDATYVLPEPINFAEGTAEGDRIDGSTIVRDWIDGAGGDDSISGFKGDDTLLGGAGNDALWGGDGDDHLVSDEGLDSMHGGDGFDSAYFDEPLAAFEVRNFVSYAVLLPGGNEDIWEQVSQVERVHFADLSLAFDFDGRAGRALDILAAILGAGDMLEPGAVGLALSVVDAGWTDVEIAHAAAAMLYAGHTNAAFVQALYANAFEAEAPQPLVDDIAGLLGGGFVSRGWLIELVAHSSWIEPVTQAAIDAVEYTGLTYFEVAA